MTPPRAANSPAVRTKILRAAEHAFAAAGFHAASLTDIADAAGSNKPMIYYHFGSKAGLFVAVAGTMLANVRLKIDAESEASASHLERLAAFVRAYAGALAEPESLAARVVTDLPALPVPLRADVLVHYDREIVQWLRDLFVSGAADGVFRKMNEHDCASAVAAIVHNFARQGLTQERAVGAATEHVVQVYARGLLAPGH